MVDETIDTNVADADIKRGRFPEQIIELVRSFDNEIAAELELAGSNFHRANLVTCGTDLFSLCQVVDLRDDYTETEQNQVISEILIVFQTARTCIARILKCPIMYIESPKIKGGQDNPFYQIVIKMNEAKQNLTELATRSNGFDIKNYPDLLGTNIIKIEPARTIKPPIQISTPKPTAALSKGSVIALAGTAIGLAAAAVVAFAFTPAKKDNDIEKSRPSIPPQTENIDELPTKVAVEEKRRIEAQKDGEQYRN